MTVINFKPTDVVERSPAKTTGEHLLLGRVLAGKKKPKKIVI